MMKYALTGLAALTFPALALGQGVGTLDGNGDGVLTMDEVQASYPEVTVDMFTTMDLNGDGALDVDEVTVAQEAGLMPATDG